MRGSFNLSTVAVGICRNPAVLNGEAQETCVVTTDWALGHRTHDSTGDCPRNRQAMKLIDPGLERTRAYQYRALRKAQTES